MDFVGIVSLYETFKEYFTALLLVLPRTYGFIVASQLLPATAVPRIARTTLILLISMPLVPTVMPLQGLFEQNVGLYFGYFAKEAALGFIMGFCMTWLFWSVQAAGTFIDNQRGAAIASSIDPLQGHESSPLGLLFSQAWITYFFSFGGFLIIVGILYASFDRWPIYELLPIINDDFPAMMLEILDLGMRLTVLFAAPIIAVMFFAEFALAMVSRFAPQVQVFILAMPIKSAIAMVLLIFYIPIMMRYALAEQDLLQVYIDRLFTILEVGRDAGGQ